MYTLILFLPLISFLISSFFGRFLGSKGVGYFLVSNMFIVLLISWFIFYEVGVCNSVTTITSIEWVKVGTLVFRWGLLFDNLTAGMLIVIISISFFVHLFSLSYMKEDPHLSRFMSYLTLFTFFMLVLVTGDNFVQMFVGWEGVGLASYLLINFWFTRYQANKSAIKAILANRVGDLGIILALSLIYKEFNSLDYDVVFSLVPYSLNSTFSFFSFELNIITLITLFLFIGAIGKSAQLGLHVWLPDAMEGPTPVSALIHAATMVTAGVFLLIRCSPLIEFSSKGLLIITIIGASTAFFAATTGLVQNDMKRIIAYSTCSQLGYMVFACGMSNYSVGFFHLMNHAFFKALLFLGAGAVIHAMNDEQDIRKMGGLNKSLPFTYTVILIGSLSLMGFPFLTGFYSKDMILEVAYSNYEVSSKFTYWLGTFSAGLTAFYSFRLILNVFLLKSKNSRVIMEHIHECDILMYLPLFILSLCSIFFGFLFKDLVVGLGTDFWGSSLLYNPLRSISVIKAEFLPFYIKLFPFFFSMFGLFLSLILFYFFQRFLYNLLLKDFLFVRRFYWFFNKRWFFDQIYFSFVTKRLLYFGYEVSFKVIDRGFFELLGPLGLVRSLNKFSSSLFYELQTGYLYHVIYTVIITVALLFVSYIAPSIMLWLGARPDFVLIMMFIGTLYTLYDIQDQDHGCPKKKK